MRQYTPAECHLDPFAKRPRQIGVAGFAGDKKVVWPLTVATVDRLRRMGVATVHLFVVAAGGWTHECDLPLAEADKLVKKWKL